MAEKPAARPPVQEMCGRENMEGEGGRSTPYVIGVGGESKMAISERGFEAEVLCSAENASSPEGEGQGEGLCHMHMHMHARSIRGSAYAHAHPRAWHMHMHI